MINRNYLPFKSARAYVDRGMAKWMGFFISEHTSALSHMGDVIDVSEEMSRDEILLALSQLYVNGLNVMVYTRLRLDPFVGKINDIFQDSFYLCGHEALIISFEDIIKLVLLEELWKI